MKALFAVSLAMALAATNGAYATSGNPAADADTNKQETVKAGNHAQTKATPPTTSQATSPPKKKSKRLSNEEGQQVMQNLHKSAKDEYRPAFPTPR